MAPCPALPRLKTRSRIEQTPCRDENRSRDNQWASRKYFWDDSMPWVFQRDTQGNSARLMPSFWANQGH